MLMLKQKPTLVFAVLNSVGEMRAMHADMMRDATLLGKVCNDCVYDADAAIYHAMLVLLSNMQC